MIASTLFDLVIGLDVHFEIVPMSPAPVPFPHLFMGMVYVPPKDMLTNLLVSNLIEMAMERQLKPPKGPVLINGLPATNTGTDVKNSLVMPHFVLPPGTMWTPMPKAPKPKIGAHQQPPPDPPVAPAGDAVLMMGSKTVTLMGSNAVRFGDLAMSCSEPVRMPSSVVMAIPKGPLVLIGGPPAIDWVQAGGALLRSKWVSNHLHGLVSRIKSVRWRNRLSKLVCFLTGHPVDVATGRVLTWATDWQLPGPIPLVFERNYASSWSARDGVLGPGWSHSLDEAVWPERGRVVYRAGDGREIEFDTFDLPDHVMRKGDQVWEPTNRLALRCMGVHEWEIEDSEGLTSEFARVPGQADRQLTRLVRIRSRVGDQINLTYDSRARLETVRDSAGRVVRFEYDRHSRLSRTLLPNPMHDGWLSHTEYRYSASGDLVAVVDPMGNATRFDYAGHLMVSETDRSGLSFHFGYDGLGAEARCVRTWGDGGIYDHEISYDPANHVTTVTNSLGHTTTYFADAAGAVVKVMDSLGAATSYEYDPRTLQKTRETDPLGAVTTWEYDQRGNCTRMTATDGAVIEVEFNPFNQPVIAVDPVKGQWRWAYDGSSRVVGRIDAIGRRTQYHWEGRRLVGLTDSAGHYTSVGYDPDGNVSSLRTARFPESRWEYDRLGRCVKAVDAKGNVRVRRYDVLGRLTETGEPDGNGRQVAYDAEGRVIRVHDLHQDVRFTYRGMGRLALRTEGGTTVSFEYDTEDQLVAIRNEAGAVYRFERGPTGEVCVEWDWRGIRRRYKRDAAGRIIEIQRSDRRISRYTHDRAGRILSVRHSDGTSESYTYRPDGQLIEAANQGAIVKLIRDPLGRVVREVIGDDWVASQYDVLGWCISIRSSRGLEQHIERNEMGDVVGMQAGLGPTDHEPWQVRIGRDALGLEIERTLAGGVVSRWERDRLGRPLRQEVSVGGAIEIARQYTWDVNDRLRMVVDAMTGPIRYQHDARGNLTAATHHDGRVELRLPDGVRNLFRTNDRSERRYGIGGELVEARTVEGVMRYEYDADGNLAKKIEPDGRTWTYHWNLAGQLAHVVRPDGQGVAFSYDAFGRRLAKTFRGRTTRWIWNGNLPVHEWVELTTSEARSRDAGLTDTGDEVTARRRRAQLNDHPAQGPPPMDSGTAEAPITWLFDPGSFTPAAKLVGPHRYGIITDHLGTPTAMHDGMGRRVWSAAIDVYGQLQDIVGDPAACPFRWPGQYEDCETGLYYNRFRYYDPAAGTYISQDPMGIGGGLALAAYVHDPLTWSDPLGLKESCGGREERPPRDRSLKSIAQEIREAGLHPASRNRRTVAVGEDAAGRLHVGSSNGLDAGQKAAAERLGVTPVRSATGTHAEEDLLREVPGLKRVGTSVRAPCGPGEHNCAGQLRDAGVEVE